MRFGSDDFIYHGTAMDISRGGCRIKIGKPIVTRHFLGLFTEHLGEVSKASEVYGRYLQKLETENWIIRIVGGEEDISNKIRYSQKLEDIDRRMAVLEEEKEADKRIRLGQARQLEYLEADVQSIKKGPSGQADEIQSNVDLQTLLEYVGTMEAMRDVPAEFEQVRATFLSQVRSIKAREHTREPYFTDLLTMIDVGVTYADETELTEDSFAVLSDAVRCISGEVTSDTLRELRKQFRVNGINILKPLDPQANIGELLKETFQ